MEEHPIIDRPTTIEVNLASLQHNVGQIKKHCGSDKKVMAIIKANAYGHGLIPIGVALEKMGGVDYLGVAFLEEGIALRRANVRLPILVLGGIYKPQIGTFLDFDLELTVSSLEKLRQVEEIARKKMPDLNADTLESAMQMVRGTACSMGIEISEE